MELMPAKSLLDIQSIFLPKEFSLERVLETKCVLSY